MNAVPSELAGWTHQDILSTLARADPAKLKAIAETILPDLGEVEVIESRTGLVMLPMRDTAGGTNFHLGEVLVSEARITAGDQEGFGMLQGRDLEAAMAMSVVDLGIALGVSHEICRAFLIEAAQAAAAADREILCRVEATRVDMETF